MPEYREFYRRHLPHWQPRGATFFVTFRLFGTLPREVIESLREETPLKGHGVSNQLSGREMLEGRSVFKRSDAYLDKRRTGAFWLAKPEIAAIVKEALHFRDGGIYDLYAYCIMSNHVHMVFRPLEVHDQMEISLEKIMASLKRHTARQANIVLGRQGPFWQEESYDYVVRNNDEFLRIVHYVLLNPVQAGLVSKWEDWPGTYCKNGLLK